MQPLDLSKQKDRNEYAKGNADKKKAYSITISISEFGNLAKFYKRFAKNNRIIIVEDVEFIGTPEQHNTGLLADTIICKETELKDKVREFIKKNSLQGESFDVFVEGTTKSILNETKL